MGRIGNFVGRVEDKIVDSCKKWFTNAKFFCVELKTNFKLGGVKCCLFNILTKIKGAISRCKITFRCFAQRLKNFSFISQIRTKIAKFSRRQLILYVILIGLGVIILPILVLIILVLLGVFGCLPNDEELRHITNNEASLVYSADEVLLGKYYTEDRSDVAFEQIPDFVISALISTEDSRFMNHDGVDYRSLCRVFVKSLILRDNSSGGGSTLSQQLVKNLYGRRSFGILSMPVAKVKEMIIASRIEEIYTKEQILAMYLNTVSFGENIFGIENAAMRYFSKHCNELSIEEGAVIVGMLKANTYYDPHVNPENAESRRNTVFHLMAKNKAISDEECDSLSKLPMILKYKSAIDYDRENGYFVAYVKTEAEKIINEYNRKNNTSYNLNTDGLQITTTLDKRAQNIYLEANNQHLIRLQKQLDKQLKNYNFWKKNKSLYENALPKNLVRKDSLIPRIFAYGMYDSVMTKSAEDSIKYCLSQLQSAVLAVEPQTGAVKVWIGGSNYQFYPFNHVVAKRQVGSTFKPILYYTALEQGVEPCRYFKNERKVYEEYDNWSPSNSDTAYNGYYSMRGALVNSINTVAAELIFEVGIDNCISTARKLGISSPIPEVPSIALGVADISLYEMVQAYSVFANSGKFNSLYVIQSIRDKNGNIIYEAQKPKNVQVLNPTNNEKLVAMLNDVVNLGTGKRIRSYGIKGDVAGKTGTTQNNTDGWFIGFTPNWVMGVWVGVDNPAIHFQNTSTGQGASTSLPIWAAGYEKMQRYRWGKKYAGNFVYSIDSIDCELWRETEFNSIFEIFDIWDEGAIEIRQQEEQQLRNEPSENTLRGKLRNLFGRPRRR